MSAHVWLQLAYLGEPVDLLHLHAVEVAAAAYALLLKHMADAHSAIRLLTDQLHDHCDNRCWSGLAG